MRRRAAAIPDERRMKAAPAADTYAQHCLSGVALPERKGAE
jgi:hypothetical protein